MKTELVVNKKDTRNNNNNNKEPMLKVASMKATIKTEETVRPEEFKRMQINASEQAWKEKGMHGQYIRDMDENIDKDKT